MSEAASNRHFPAQAVRCYLTNAPKKTFVPEEFCVLDIAVVIKFRNCKGETDH